MPPWTRITPSRMSGSHSGRHCEPQLAIEPESTLDRKKLGDVLEMLKRQDPTFRGIENEETGQTIISGMGELHLEVIKHKLLRDFNLNVKVHKPRVSYKETVNAPAEVTPATSGAKRNASVSAFNTATAGESMKPTASFLPSGDTRTQYGCVPPFTVFFAIGVMGTLPLLFPPAASLLVL